jgi:hypothetical protein
MTHQSQRVPDVPRGYEWLDLIWSQMVPAADSYVVVLPSDAGPRWATERGVRFLSVSLFVTRAAELHRLPRHFSLRRMRARQLRRLERHFEGQALAMLSAIVDRVRVHHPEASAAQLLLAPRDTCREMLHQASVRSPGGR